MKERIKKMTKAEYNKMRLERHKKNVEQFDRAKKVGCEYPPDLHYLWDFMQKKNIGLPYCLGMIYNLGLLDGMQRQRKDKRLLSRCRKLLQMR